MTIPYDWTMAAAGELATAAVNCTEGSGYATGGVGLRLLHCARVHRARHGRYRNDQKSHCLYVRGSRPSAVSHSRHRHGEACRCVGMVSSRPTAMTVPASFAGFTLASEV